MTSIARDRAFRDAISSALLPCCRLTFDRRSRPTLARRTRDVDDQPRRRLRRGRAQLRPARRHAGVAGRAGTAISTSGCNCCRCSSARCWRRRRSARRSASCSATTRCAPPCCTARGRRTPLALGANRRVHGLETRCHAGAQAAAAAQGHGAFWPAAMCCEAAVSSPPGAAPAIGQALVRQPRQRSRRRQLFRRLHPAPAEVYDECHPRRDVLGADTLMLFLPGRAASSRRRRARCSRRRRTWATTSASRAPAPSYAAQFGAQFISCRTLFSFSDHRPDGPLVHAARRPTPRRATRNPRLRPLRQTDGRRGRRAVERRKSRECGGARGGGCLTLKWSQFVGPTTPPPRGIASS